MYEFFDQQDFFVLKNLEPIFLRYFISSVQLSRVAREIFKKKKRSKFSTAVGGVTRVALQLYRNLLTYS